jgi:hypothetical protein
MVAARWRSLNRVDRARMREARLQAHYAAQWLACIARAYVATHPNDVHTSLGWDDAQGALATQALSGGGSAGLKISELTLVLWDQTGRGEPLRLDGRRDADIRDWLGPRLRQMGLDADALDAPSPYQMPAHPIGSGAPYAGAALAEPLAELAVWYGDADLVLAEARQRVLARGLDAPPVRCWPHHFDLDSLIQLGAGRTVGAGFCPGDEHYDEPYFYVSSHPRPADVARLPSLPLAGHWHTHHFTAAIALARNVVAATDQKAESEAFLNAAIDALL